MVNSEDILIKTANNLIEKWRKQFQADYGIETTKSIGMKINMPNRIVCGMKKDKIRDKRFWDYLRAEALKFRIIVLNEYGRKN